MDPALRPVKSSRRYDSSGRRARAEARRHAIVEVAQGLFLHDGYAATTIARIASEAEVSVETIYKGFGGKAGLVRAIRDRALAGDAPESSEARSDSMRATETDPRRIIENWSTLTTEVMPRVAPILLVVGAAAAADPSLVPLRDEFDAARLARMRDNARHLHDRGALRRDVGLDDARDVLFAYSAPELYDLLVLRQRWALDAYGRFIARGMAAALLP